MSISYTAEQFFDGEKLHHSTRVTIVDGIVTSIEPYAGTPDFHLLSPGLIDVQMNGFGSVDASAASQEDFEQLDRDLLTCGTTSWLATIVTAPLDRLSQSLQNIDDFVSEKATGCLGVHIEGPFLGDAPGAHNPAWIIPFDSEWLASLPSSVALMTVAPEQPNAASFISQLSKAGIVVSIGHTRASFEEFNSAVGAGASMATHLFNGMSGVHHRDDGVALFALNDSRVVAGVIGDLSHVSPHAVKLAFVAKGSAGICLVSDSVAWESEWAQRRGVQLRDGAPRLEDGTLAGSSTPLAKCVQRVVQECEVSLVDALTSATTTPARLLGYPQLGRIIVGQRADVVLFDEQLSVVEARRGLVSIRA